MEALTALIKETRINLLKIMHHHILKLDDEEKYYTWVTYGVPDEPTEEDYDFIADNDEEWERTFNLFTLLMKNS